MISRTRACNPGSLLASVTCGAVALLVLPVSAATAQVTVLNGPSTVGSDSVNGRKLQILSANAGDATVTLRTEPAIALVCDQATPTTLCFAYVQPNIRVRISPRRATPPSGRPAGPTVRQWGRDCADNTGPDCIVTMDQNRTVLIDWAR